MTDSGVQLSGVEVIEFQTVGQSTMVLDASSINNLDLTHPVEIVSDDGDSLTLSSEQSGVIQFKDEAGRWQTSDPIVGERYQRTITDGDVVLQVDLPFPYQNLLRRYDVNRSTTVTANDPLIVINELSRRQFSDSLGRVIDPLELDVIPEFFYDVNGDGHITALDALQGINQLARQAEAEGEWLQLVDRDEKYWQRDSLPPDVPNLRLREVDTTVSSFDPREETHPSFDQGKGDQDLVTSQESAAAVDELLADDEIIWLQDAVG